MRGRKLWAAKLLLTVPVVVLLVLASTGILPFWSAAAWVAALVALSWRFRRWEADEVAGQPRVPIGGASPQPGEVVRYAPWSSRVLVTTAPAVAGSVAIVLLLLNEIPAWRLLAAPLAIGLGWYVWRGLHLGLELGWDEVLVANTLRTYRFRWSDVSRIYLGDDREISFALRGGSRIEVIATRWAPGRAELVHAVRRYAEPHGIEFEDELLRL